MDNKVPDKRVITFQPDETRKEVGSDTQTEQQTADKTESDFGSVCINIALTLTI